MTTKMKFKTESGEYVVKWVYSGWSYATARVYKLKRLSFMFINFNRCVFVWESSNSKLGGEAKRMLPNEMYRWFESAVEEYEYYQKEWDKFNSAAIGEKL